MNIEASNSRNTPTYLAHYDMRRPPFATHIENDMYYADASLTQRLDLLLHLTQYGNELLLVTAEDGGGKTSMLHKFIQRAQSNWSVGHFTAADCSSKYQLIKQIYQQFPLADNSQNKPVTSIEVKAHLTSFLLSNRRVVLLVDDADELKTDALDLLLDLSTIIRHEKSSLQIILFCRPQIKIQLAAPELEQKHYLKQRKIDLPMLTMSQTDNLIQHRLNVTGMKGRKIFTRSTINRIFKATKGNPDKICEFAHQILTDSTPKERHSFFNLDYILHPALPQFISALAILLVILLVVGLLFMREIVNFLYPG